MVQTIVYGMGILNIRFYALAAASCLFFATGCQRAPKTTASQEISFQDLQAAQSSQEWLTHGHDYSNQRFSPLAQVDASNAQRLVAAFVFQTGIGEGFETTPLVSNGVMYLSTAFDNVFAVNASDGTLLWRYHPTLKPARKLCCGPVYRGVALADGLVFIGQVDGKLVALDQYTGAVQWSTQVAENAQGYSITSAPLVYKDLVLIGVAGGEFAIRGSLSAYSIDDGHLVWRWYSTDARHWGAAFSENAPGGYSLHRNIARERATYHLFADAWRRGGGAVWTTPAADVRRNAIYLTTGNPWPDYSSYVRPGDNLFTDSIVALDASTGRMKWYFQEVPHDVWDWDSASPPLLFDVKDASGQTVSAVGEAGKTGWFYIVNRDTGKLIRLSDPFVPQMNIFRPPTAAGTVEEPGGGGGSNWSPVSFNPSLQLAVVSAISHPVRFYTRNQLRASPLDSIGSGAGDDESAPHYGLASGIDVDTGKILWQDRFDRALMGGSLSTAGGVTFVGESSGYFDALETRTGKVLWRFQTGAGVNAPPIAFAVDGEEYVAVASGGNERVHSRLGDSLFVFHIPR
jgi:PQQ-dependent dehydrogenase (methanol/ethanol family)